MATRQATTWEADGMIDTTIIWAIGTIGWFIYVAVSGLWLLHDDTERGKRHQ